MTQVVIWDEAPMMHIHAFEALDGTFEDFLKVYLLFGNKVLNFGGDLDRYFLLLEKELEMIWLNHVSKGHIYKNYFFKYE